MGAAAWLRVSVAVSCGGSTASVERVDLTPRPRTAESSSTRSSQAQQTHPQTSRPCSRASASARSVDGAEESGPGQPPHRPQLGSRLGRALCGVAPVSPEGGAGAGARSGRTRASRAECAGSRVTRMQGAELRAASSPGRPSDSDDKDASGMLWGRGSQDVHRGRGRPHAARSRRRAVPASVRPSVPLLLGLSSRGALPSHSLHRWGS